MCGRFTLRATATQLVEFFDLFQPVELPPRCNIAPTQQVAIVRQTPSGRDLSLLRWGLIPSWAKDAKIGSSLINARSESAAEKPSFRSAFKKRRCLIPCDGFYEWEVISGQKVKQPWLIGVGDTPVFAFAGLWETWHDPAGVAVETCSILTTSSNELLRPFHDRMPVILDPADFALWLDPAVQTADPLLPLMAQFPADRMHRYRVSTVVNSSRNERPECAVPLDSAAQ
ncbi:MAG: SOS response-associated peptidase [Planctomycetota bacterium]|nr:SOS response-associated peptidase [Planctomycetota bacterium]